MKLAVGKEYIDIEDVESYLTTLRHLVCLHYDYFKWDKDYVKANPYELTCRYEEHNALVSAIIDVIDNAQELAAIAIENHIKLTKAVKNICV